MKITTLLALSAFVMSTSQLDMVTAGATPIVKPAKGTPQTVTGIKGAATCRCGKGSTVKVK